jgi:MraZ protein
VFLGQYYHNLDDKGRVILPARMRESLADQGGAYLMRGFDKNLMLVTSATFETIYERVNLMSVTDLKARQLRRYIFSSAVQVEFDKNGRILLPQYLRDAAEINDEAVIVGVGSYLEIWSPRLWAAQNEQLNDINTSGDWFAPLDISFG